MKRVLLVEDEENIANLLKLNLELDEFEVVTAKDGMEGFKYFENERFDILLLDIMLPIQSGIQLCQKIRLHDNKTPIIFISAKGSVQERIEGLKVGADDYIVKPFDFEELALRIQKLITRTSVKSLPTADVIKFGNNEVNFNDFIAFNGTKEFQLTKKEALLLKLLYEQKNYPVSRKEILEAVWGYSVLPSTRTIDNFILMLRKYFEDDPRKPKFIVSVRGIGYKFVDNK